MRITCDIFKTMLNIRFMILSCNHVNMKVRHGAGINYAYVQYVQDAKQCKAQSETIENPLHLEKN